MAWPECVKPSVSAWVSVENLDQCLIFVLTMIDLQIACRARLQHQAEEVRTEQTITHAGSINILHGSTPTPFYEGSTELDSKHSHTVWSRVFYDKSKS